MEVESSNQYAKEIELNSNYNFIHNNFIISSQNDLFLLLEEKNDLIKALNFKFKIYKYGYPNDEIGMTNYITGIELYGFYQVYNSEWIHELKSNNRQHPQHLDIHYSNYKHFVIRFKDVTLEVISENYSDIKMTREELMKIVNKQLSFITAKE
ncbi:hypothetical protein EYY60_10780 [Flavobacterium zhairuonense]|uniref:hypothetical protein n=1 Tax=Flavobacterium zhairuonense TaxID=2493631 RepID=UPI001051E9C3|nr:hypothetical protein [Flavobacterium zhairuonense]KAF2509996.1 hypothetical protein EYY60_10780 [Flavobacterium zhairuonense]